MKKMHPIIVLPALILCAHPLFVTAGTLEQSFADGKAFVDARYRYETVDDTVHQDAKASTLRSRIGFSTSTDFPLSASVDFENITRLGSPDYNSTTNGQTQYAIVADPASTEVNQAFLNFKMSDSAAAKYGRQRIIYDNARFVGNVGWRQNEQTYDALRFSYSATKDIALDLVNIQKINTITGGETYTNTNLLNASFGNIAGGKLVAYAYLLDDDATPNAATSTLGAYYSGAVSSLLYRLEYAKQSDYADRTTSFDASYTMLELGYKLSADTKVFVAMETLGSDNGASAFQTPLATKHAFNGWADKFLATPANGLVDTYLKAVTKVAGVGLVAVYHDFSSDQGSTDYGAELDLLASKKLNDTFTVLAKYASYSADSFSADTDKIWLQLEMKLKQ
jgi:hypothetical protein